MKLKLPVNIYIYSKKSLQKSAESHACTHVYAHLKPLISLFLNELKKYLLKNPLIEEITYYIVS